MTFTSIMFPNETITNSLVKAELIASEIDRSQFIPAYRTKQEGDTSVTLAYYDTIPSFEVSTNFDTDIAKKIEPSMRYADKQLAALVGTLKMSKITAQRAVADGNSNVLADFTAMALGQLIEDRNTVFFRGDSKGITTGMVGDATLVADLDGTDSTLTAAGNIRAGFNKMINTLLTPARLIGARIAVAATPGVEKEARTHVATNNEFVNEWDSITAEFGRSNIDYVVSESIADYTQSDMHTHQRILGWIQSPRYCVKVNSVNPGIQNEAPTAFGFEYGIGWIGGAFVLDPSGVVVSEDITVTSGLY